MKAKTGHSRKGVLKTPHARQSRVIAAGLAGKSKSQIARETGLNRKTVRRILSQTEVKAMLEAYRDDLRAIVPHALNLIKHDLSIMPKKGRHANPDSLKAALDILKGAQVAVPLSKGELEVRRDRFSEMTDEELDYYIKTGKELHDPEKPVGKPGNA